MDIILLEQVEGLGKLGDVVAVKNGYARNFLLPQGKALRANKDSVKEFEARREELEKLNRAKINNAQDLADDINGKDITIIRMASDSGALYGSVSARDISEALKANNYKVERGQVLIGQAIKELGVHDVKVRFHPEVHATIKVNVAKNEDDALFQLEINAKEADDSIAQDDTVNEVA